MDDYNDLMEQAAKYRELARFQDEHMRRQLLNVAFGLECKARDLKRQSEGPPSKSG